MNRIINSCWRKPSRFSRSGRYTPLASSLRLWAAPLLIWNIWHSILISPSSIIIPTFPPAAEFQFRAEEQQRLIRKWISACPSSSENMSRNASFPWQRDTKRNRRAASAASSAIVCVWRKPQRQQRQAAFLTLPPPSPSVPTKTRRS